MKKKILMNGRDGGGDEFDRPLIMLKYGDRVQVVSMYSRGLVVWMKGCGYIRLENEKQLMKGEGFLHFDLREAL